LPDLFFNSHWQFLMVVKLSSKGQITIPKPIREALGLRPGTMFHISQQKNAILLEPVQPTSPIDALYGKYAQSELLALLEEEHCQELTRPN
jgi:AbrB family looped-hinge helix DNA binding protein